MEPLKLLITDLDGTLLGDDAALEEFKRWHVQQGQRLRLVYSSGRFLDSIFHSIERYELPEPAGVICGVGTEIHDLLAGDRVAGWPRDLSRWNADRIREACVEFRKLQEQPIHLLSQYKVSYYGYDLDELFLHGLEQRLARAGQEVTVVYSSNRDLDILPVETNKGAAAAYLAEHWHICANQVAVAGDTGNDAAMFRQGFRGIVVANALEELKRVQGPDVYHAQLPFAAGVLEGVCYWQDRVSLATGDRAL